MGAFAEASCEGCLLERKAPVNKRVPIRIAMVGWLLMLPLDGRFLMLCNLTDKIETVKTQSKA